MSSTPFITSEHTLTAICEPRRSLGFTMVELLVGLTIFVVVIAAVIGTAATGLRVYKEARSYRVDETKLVIALEKYESRLRSAELSSLIPFEGTDSDVRFAAIATFLDDGGDTLQTQPARIGYRFVDHEFHTDLDPYALATGKDIKPTAWRSQRLAENVSGSFRYFAYDQATKRYVWTDSWTAPDALPLAVLLTLYFDDDDVPFVQRTVVIPAALPDLRFVTLE